MASDEGATPSDRSVLIERRRLLKLRLARADRSRSFRQLAPVLCAAGIRPFAKIPPVACRRAFAPFIALPGRDERLYWPEIAGGQCRRWESPAERDRLVQAALLAIAAPDERIDVLFHTEFAGLRLSVGRLAAAAPLILDANDETLWLIPSALPHRIIEVSAIDDEVCTLVMPPST